MRLTATASALVTWLAHRGRRRGEDRGRRRGGVCYTHTPGVAYIDSRRNCEQATAHGPPGRIAKDR